MCQALFGHWTYRGEWAWNLRIRVSVTSLGDPFLLTPPWQDPRSELWIRRRSKVAPDLCHRYGVQWVGDGERVTSRGVLVNP